MIQNEIKKLCYIYVIQINTNQVRSSIVLLIALVFAMSEFSCKRKGDKYIDQGEIHYNIEYIGRFTYPTEALPHNLIVSFKDNKILFEMTGIGNSGISNLTNPKEGIYDTYYSFFNVKRYYYAGKEGETFPGFEAMKGMNIKKTQKTAVICGYNCKNAQVTFERDRNKVYEIWYTDEIDVENPNECTPFSEIDGVLLRFFFIMGNSELHFSAETVYNKDVPEHKFQRKDHYLRVSKKDITALMNGMVERSPGEPSLRQ